MAKVFKRNNAGVRRLLQSEMMLNLTKKYASNYGSGAEVKPFIGFDRAKTIIYK